MEIKIKHSFLWVEVCEPDRIVSLTSIALMADGKVKWNGSPRENSCWFYKYFQQHDIGVMIVQFAAGSTSKPKRHYMREVGEGRFRLAEKADAVYNDTDLWVTGSVTHNNSNTVVMMRFNIDEFQVSAPGADEPVGE